MGHDSATSQPSTAPDSRFDALMKQLLATNAFYRRKLAEHGWSPDRPPRFSDLTSLPFTTKHELVEDQSAHPPFGTNLTWPLDRYTRLHQTSGTTGRPLLWLDTRESWRWWLDCWQTIYDAAGVGTGDRVFVAFSFGPFIGFWSAFEAAQALGATVIPGGGLSSRQRLEMIHDLGATVLVCTPTYALRLAEVAGEIGMDTATGPVRVAIHAGEAGASIPNVRARLENEWGARIIDHPGATEVGAWGYSCGHDHVVHVNEAEFIPEVIDPESTEAAIPNEDGGTAGELVLTNLGRTGSPVIRYRTGDRVETLGGPCRCGRAGAALRGGVLGRVDNMVVVRGINVFPSAIENIIRAFDHIDEFDARVRTDREMTELVIRIEVATTEADSTVKALSENLQTSLHLRATVQAVPPGTLPRYELKARRFTFS